MHIGIQRGVFEDDLLVALLDGEGAFLFLGVDRLGVHDVGLGRLGLLRGGTDTGSHNICIADSLGLTKDWNVKSVRVVGYVLNWFCPGLDWLLCR